MCKCLRVRNVFLACGQPKRMSNPTAHRTALRVVQNCCATTVLHRRAVILVCCQHWPRHPLLAVSAKTLPTISSSQEKCKGRSRYSVSFCLSPPARPARDNRWGEAVTQQLLLITASPSQTKLLSLGEGCASPDPPRKMRMIHVETENAFFCVTLVPSAR